MSLASLLLLKDFSIFGTFSLLCLRRNVIHKMSHQQESQEKPSHWKRMCCISGIGNKVGLLVDSSLIACNFEGYIEIVDRNKGC